MQKLKVEIEYKGNFVHAGDIVGTDSSDACFLYDEEYMSNAAYKPLSISLPFKEEPFTAAQTRCYFESLLPEGFTKKCVADRIKVDESDYLSILSCLGNECIGAVRIAESEASVPEPAYSKWTDDDLLAFAREGAVKSAQILTNTHLSLAGASGKTGLYYDEENKTWYLPLGTAPSTHIVKQSHIRLKKIVLNERLCLLTAARLGIETPESFAVDTGSGEENILFATRRYDRVFSRSGRIISGKKAPARLHQEDFAQAMGIPSGNKYEKENKGYLKKIFEILLRNSSNALEDMLKVWDICIFNYFIGNTDNHIKNLSIIYNEDFTKLRLAPAYDIVSTVVYDSHSQDMSLSIGGEYNIRKITRDSFEQEAENIGLGKKIAMKRFDRMAGSFKQALIRSGKELEEKSADPEVKKMCEKILSCGGLSEI